MGKVEYRKLNAKQRKILEDEWRILFRRALRAGTLVELVGDLLTPSERIMLARRIQVARRLLAGHSHFRIKHELHVGFPQIQAVDRWLQEKLDAYRRIIPPLVRESDPAHWKIDPRSLRGLRKYYPAYFWFLDLFLQD